MTAGPVARTSRGVILLYHRVTTTDAPFQLAVMPSMFEGHMRWIRKNCDPMSLGDFVAASAEGRLPERAVVVTLDDGYLDNLTEASAILAAFEIPATFFVTCAFLHHPGEYWWDRLARMAVDEPTLAALHARLRPMSRDQRDEELDDLAKRLPSDTSASARPMVADEIRDLAGRPGHEIGAHTIHHLSLPAQPPDVQLQELAESRRVLEQVTGRPVTSVAYPFGDATKTTLGLALEAGFRLGVGVTTPPQLAGPLMLPRVDVTSLSVLLEGWLEASFRGAA